MSKVSGKLRAAWARLDALYARLPPMVCKGLCAVACGPVPMTGLEARRLQVTTHAKPRTVLRLTLPQGTPTERCGYLTADDRCQAYAVRPLICRVWGLTRLLSCMHGCVPERWITEPEFLALAQEIERLGGPPFYTSPDGLVQIAGASFLSMGRPTRSVAAIEANAERTRSLRALHGGRIMGALHQDDDLL